MYFRIVLVVLICIALMPVPCVALLQSVIAQSPGKSGERMPRPRPGKPEGILPDLDEIQRESSLEREPLQPIPSTVRSSKNPEQPWNGRRVGDPAREGTLDHPDERNQIRRAHARKRMSPPPPLLDDQFVQNFFTWAVLRSPNSSELTFWNDQLRVAYAQGQTSVKLVAVALGKTLFESAEYSVRNRDNHWYVYDLYKTFLMRDPDSSGWAYWESVVPANGRENVRRAFEEAPEFAGIFASIIPNGSATANAASLISARIDPRNQPGHGMLARDATWSVPLLSLPGRNGLDLGLALSYSSQVWTRSGPNIHFDEDNGFPSPGFRLGFPVIQRKAFDAQTAKNSFLLVTATGQRVQLRQVGSSNIYEAADSSYLQLTDNSPSLLLRSTDGTQLSFLEVNNEFVCWQVKDRNGNYITNAFNNWGRTSTITDTLGRVITFNYDSNANLVSITQSWNGQPSHQWVSFGWSTRTMQSSFSGVAVVGTANGTVLPVITQVSLNDTSYFTFDYNNSLQVTAIRNYFGGVERNASTFTYETPASDVPRLLDSRVSAQNWTGVNGVPAQVITQYSVAADGACVLTAPDGTIYKEYYGTGWQKGLTTQSEVWSGGVRQKWTTSAWTQDNTAVSYEVNPRVVETNVYDASGNRRRTVIDYGPYAQYGLPYSVKEYAADGLTEIRQTITDYNLSQAYLDRRIIGLVSQVQLKNTSSYESKITYDYDDPARLQALPAAAVQHDSSYNTSVTARGNVTAVSRWDVNDINNATKKLTTFANYFTTGAPSSGTDPAGHQSSISYADSFSDSVNRNTFAYPTTMTDADGFSSYVQYNYDFGATTRTQSPAPAGQSLGAIQTMSYNSLGQLELVTSANNGAYKRFWYGANYAASYATVNNVADELYSIAVTDGLGRVMGSFGNHPGSTGGYFMVSTIYDQMGRAVKVSNPTEIYGSWAPAGDDAAGLYYTQQTYDWNGRPLVTTNTDGTTKEVSYAGCGCAGGAVVTLTDEGTIDAGVAKRRQQRVYSDVLGRSVKTEILNWQGGSVYATTVNTYNARDQVTQIRQYAGVQGSSSYQDTTMTYDGYGRIKTKHVPEHTTGTAVTWTYNVDGTVQSTTDPRGATAAFTYNNRHLPTSVTHTLSGSPTINVTYTNDAAGNRTSMTDGLGNVSFNYDQLSRMTSETRYYAGLNRSYTMNYGYNLNDQLTSISYPGWSQQVGYNFDATGRLNSVTGNGFVTGYYQGTWPNQTWIQQSVASFASNIVYRASNSVKQMSYGNGLQVALSYNAKQQLTQYQVSNFANSVTAGATYGYYNDGKIRFADQINNAIFDRAFSFDHAGRMKEALTGSEAHGGSTPDGPYRESYSYDVWGNTVSQTTRLWNASPVTTTAPITNNSNPNWGYDSNGFVMWDTNNGYQTNYTYDAAGRRNRLVPWFASIGFDHPPIEFAYDFDGQGRSSRQVETRWGEDPETWQLYYVTSTKYYLHSTMLGGQVVAELDSQGNRILGHVYAEGMRIASASFGSAPAASVVNWEYTDPITGSQGYSDILRQYWGTTELSTLGSDITNPPPPLDAQTYQSPVYTEPVKQTYYQIEGGPSDSYGVDSWYTNAVNQDFDRHMAETYWRHGFRDWAMAIVANNPNVGVQSEQYDQSGRHRGTSFRWGAQAAAFLMGINSDIESGRLIDATGGYGEVVGYSLDSPQNALTTDDRKTIDNKGQGQDCDVSVDFTGDSVNGMKNGENYYHGNPGLGFTVSISNLGAGGIASIGPNKVDAKGYWVLEQLMSLTYWTVREKDTSPQTAYVNTFSDRIDQGSIIRHDNKSGGWIDHPGPNLKNQAGQLLNAHHSKWNFLIKAHNGKKECYVAFHAEMKFNNGIFTAHWGPGLY